jgi:predicted TIM-barrel fold metal-dependent hydrolase
MIVDAHVHAFPQLCDERRPDSAVSTLLYLQKFVSDSPSQAVRCAKDNAVIEDRSEWAVWNPDDSGLEGALDVSFRVGRYGRLEWTKGGQDYYLNLYGPTLQDLSASPAYILAEMDYAGVSMAILQNAWLYGHLNDYFAEAQRTYPGRFVGTVQVNEARADEDGQIDELRRGVQDLGLKALYYATPRFFEVDYRRHIDDARYNAFWDEVRALGIPVFWDITGSPEPELRGSSPFERYMAQMRRFAAWLENAPDIQCVLVHGVPLGHLRSQDELKSAPDELWSIWKHPNVHLELLFPMQVSHPVPGGSVWRYPYLQLKPLVEELFDTLGAEKLVWGSDLPNIQRNCTYRQGLDYLECHDLGLPESDLELLYGGNITRILNLDGEASTHE